MRLPYTDFSATYEVAAPFRIPAHPGSLWRGVIGRALRREGCAQQRVCQDVCQLDSECLYRKLFDPPMPQPAPHRFLRGQKEAPPPLLPLMSWSGNQLLEVGDSLRIGLRCLGNITAREKECLGNVLRAIPNARLGRDGGQVDLVSMSDPLGDEKSASARASLAMAQDSLSARIRLQTPLWLEQDGQLLTQIPFAQLFTFLMRRLTTLCSLYGVHDPDDDAQFLSLRAIAEQVTVTGSRLIPLHWERHSWESDVRHPLHGVLGELTLHGPLLPLLPFLRMAEVAHLGKSTSFGLGHMQIELLQGPAQPHAATQLPEGISHAERGIATSGAIAQTVDWRTKENQAYCTR